MKNLLPLAILGLTDSLAIVFSGFLAYQLRLSSLFTVDPYLHNPSQYWLLLVVALFLWHLIAAAGGAYRRKPAIFKIDELLFHYKASILLVFLVMAATFLYRQYDYSRLIVVFTGFFLIFIGNIFRQLSHRLMCNIHCWGIGNRTACLFGESVNSSFLRQRILNNPGCGLKILDCLCSNDTELLNFLSVNKVDDFFLFREKADYDYIWQLREAAKNPDMVIHLVPTFANLYLRNIQGFFFDGTVMISMSSPTSRVATLAFKRLCDTIISGLSITLLSPLLLVIGLLIKVDSPGPALFKQRRIGLHGKEFSIYKFRTMRSNAQPYAETPRSKGDPRITRVGSILRSTGLDEIPQLLNVLKGEMSLVGPRPEMPFIAEKYTVLEKQRLKAKPGITGLWQVYARSENLPIHHHIEYDLFYIENMSILLDFIIIIDTVPTAIMRAGI